MSKLNQIAKQLGVSTATVSRALNNKPGVSMDLRERIRGLAVEMNYVPSIIARSLATSTTRTIGFLSVDRHLPLTADPFYLLVMHGAEQELSRHNYFLIVNSVNPDNLKSAEDVQLIRERRVDGLILPSPFFPQEFILSVKATGIPTVLVDNSLFSIEMDCILVNDEEAGYKATRHLIQHGQHAITALSGPQDWISVRRRVAGYLRAMQDAGLPTHVCYQPDSTNETGYLAMQDALRQSLQPGAVFAINDAMAMGALRAIHDAGKRVPEDMMVIGVDDVEMASHIQPPLTTMRVPKRQLGFLAARRLMDLVQKKENELPITTLVQAELVLRRSCGCQRGL